jgi:hypothetical protein
MVHIQYTVYRSHESIFSEGFDWKYFTYLYVLFESKVWSNTQFVHASFYQTVLLENKFLIIICYPKSDQIL